jgi:DMSO reductase anchor subunit
MMNRPFHEWPLVLFTALGIAGGGMIATAPLWLVDPVGHFTGEDLVPVCVGVLLTALGLVVSVAHLGHAWRARWALGGVGRSPLATEVALAGAVVCSGGAAWFAATVPGLASVVLTFYTLTVLLGAAFLLSIGLVYALPGQPAWSARHVTVSPFLTGLASGSFVWTGSRTALGGRPALALMALDALVFAFRWRAIARLPRHLTVAHPELFEQRHLLLAFRLALVNVLPVTCLVGPPRSSRYIAAALAGLAVGLLIDRIAFYGLAAAHTTEAEIGRIDELIGG